MGNEARIKLGLDGDKEAIAGLRGVKKAAEEMRGEFKKSERDYDSYSSKSSQGVTAHGLAVTGLKEVFKAAYHAAADFSRASNDVKPINFQQSADRAKAFDDTLTRMAVRGGKQVDELKSKFKQTGVEIGYMPERVAATARALTKMTYSTDTADSMKALGDEANDTDRSLEEMAGLGEVLYNKLGVPMDKIGEAIGKIKSVAGDLQTVGGHIALEDTLVRLGPLLARLQGGVERSSALIGVLGKGKSQQVAEEESAVILGSIEGADRNKLIRKLREVSGDRNYKPFARDPVTGRMQMRKDVPRLLQKAFRRAPGGMAAITAFFGGDVGAAETFMNANFDEVDQQEQGPARARAKAAGLIGAGEAFDLGDIKPSDTQRIKAIENAALGGKGVTGSKFMNETAGTRRATDVERGNVELNVGDVTQGQRDKQNAAFAGRRELQAAVDTAQGYLPGAAQDVINLGRAAGVEARAGYDAREFPQNAPAGGGKIDLTDATINKLAAAAREGQPYGPPQPGPASLAVEHNKAANRPGSN